MQPRFRMKSDLSVGKLITPDQSTRIFIVVVDLYSLLFISEE